MTGTAIFSPCCLYRYVLTREWDDSKPTLAMICLNPSTATAEVSDPTVTRQVRRAIRMGCGKFTMLNLFAFRSTYPEILMGAADPIGAENDSHILKEAKAADIVIVAWGGGGPAKSLIPARSRQVLGMLKEHGIVVSHLGLTNDGQPRHPLYLSYDVQPKVWC